MQSLPTKLVELDLSGEVPPDNIFHLLADGWFEIVLVYLC